MCVCVCVMVAVVFTLGSVPVSCIASIRPAIALNGPRFCVSMASDAISALRARPLYLCVCVCVDFCCCRRRRRRSVGNTVESRPLFFLFHDEQQRRRRQWATTATTMRRNEASATPKLKPTAGRHSIDARWRRRDPFERSVPLNKKNPTQLRRTHASVTPSQSSLT